MARVRTNFIYGFVDNNPLAIGGTSLSSSALSGLAAVTGSDIAVIVIDPDSRYGAPEVVYVTAHTASATTATISRAQDGTTARQHVQGTRWVHAPVKLDFDHGNLDGLADDDHTIYVKTDAARGITGDQGFSRSSSTNRAINIQVTGDSNPRLEVFSDGKQSWGSGSASTDTNLYRAAADSLKTDDNFTVGGGTLYVGADCSLYRSGTDSLQTDDALRVNSTLRIDGKETIATASSTSASLGIRVTTDAADRFGVDASGKMTWGDGTNPVDINLYRSSSGVLKTDNTIVANRLDIGSTLYAHAPVGSVLFYVTASAPSGWLVCDGSAVSRTTYSNLYSLIGTTFGNGDGVNTFNLPNIGQKYIRGHVAGVTTLGSASGLSLTSTGTSGSGGSQTVSTGTESALHDHLYGAGSNGTKSTSQESSTHTHSVTVSNHTHSLSVSGTINDIILNAIIKY